ncbi:MAG TPA: hypothetical protein VHE09_01775, partial [Rhizomicrobium sp.]|nr:hypothetical protein [Rhizomicrobium sp.]
VRPVAAATCACAIAIAAANPALATVKPIAGTDVGLERDPGNSIVTRGSTNADGNISFRDLAPGHYTLTIDSKSLSAAIEKARSANANKKSGSSLSIGVGGVFGGGSSHSSSSHQDTKGGPAYGHPDKTTHSSSSGGGIGVGLSIPVGGSSDSGDKRESSTETVVVTGSRIPQEGLSAAGSGVPFISTKTPLRPADSGDIGIGFDVPQGGGSVAFAIGYEWQPAGPNRAEDANAAMGDVSTTRMKTVPDAGPKPAQDVNNVLAEVSTTRMKVAPDTDSTAPHEAPVQTSRSNIKHGMATEDVGPPPGDVGTARMKSAPDAGPKPAQDVNNVIAEVNTARLKTPAGNVNGDGLPDMAVANLTIVVRNGLGNTIGRKLTDGKGTVLFQQLPSGEAAFVVKKSDLESAAAKLAQDKPATVVLRVTENGRAIASATAQLPLDAPEMRVPFTAKEGGKRGINYGLQAGVHF